jgi:hypothetical protein
MQCNGYHPSQARRKFFEDFCGNRAFPPAGNIQGQHQPTERQSPQFLAAKEKGQQGTG